MDEMMRGMGMMMHGWIVVVVLLLLAILAALIVVIVRQGRHAPRK